LELRLPYDYQLCLEGSERVSWKLDDVFSAGTRLDFDRPFLPEGLAQTERHTNLSEAERRSLNQIMGHSYVSLFSFFEEYIIAVVVRRVDAELMTGHANRLAVRALSRFTDEELKHQQLFTRYKDASARDFGVPCEVLGNAGQVAAVMLKKRPLSTMILTLHLELMTQGHYTESVRDDALIDPTFSRLLRFHWLEEVQHARIDALEIQKLVAHEKPEGIAAAVVEYIDLLDALSGLLRGQAEMDMKSLSRKLGRQFSDDERLAGARLQHRAYQRMLLATGMVHPTFKGLIARLGPEHALEVTEKAAAYIGE